MGDGVDRSFLRTRLTATQDRLRARQTYRNILYLLIAIPLGGIYYTLLLFAFVVGIVFTIVLVGIPIVVATILIARVCVEGEQWLVNALTTGSVRRPREPPRLRDQPSISTLWAIFTASSTWKGIAFLLIRAVLGFLTFLYLLVVGSLTLAFLAAPVSGEITVFEAWSINSPVESFLVFFVGLALVVVSVLLLDGAARITGSVSVALLEGSESDDRT